MFLALVSLLSAMSILSRESGLPFLKERIMFLFGDSYYKLEEFIGPSFLFLTLGFAIIGVIFLAKNDKEKYG